MVQSYIMKSETFERRNFLRICFVAVIAAMLVLTSLAFAPRKTAANADAESHDFAPPVSQTQTVYFLFDDPISLSADANYLYALDGTEIKRFSLSDFSYSEYPLFNNAQISSAPDSFSVRGETAVTVENGATYLYNNDGKTQLEIFGESCIAAYTDETHIYVQTDPYTVKKSSRTENLLETYTSETEIKSFTVFQGVIYFACAHGSTRRNDIAYFESENTATLAVENLPEIISMYAVGESKLAVLDYKGITLYARGISELISDGSVYTDVDATAMTATANGIFVLDANKAVTRYCADLSQPTCVLASASDELGFFSSPADVITRKNKTYIADRNNNRIVIHDGEKYSVLSEDLFRPIAVTADHIGNIYAAYSENKIAVFDSSLLRLTSPENETVSVMDENGEPYGKKVAVKDIKCDLKGTLYILSKDGGIFLKAKDGEHFTPLDGASENVSLIDISPNSAYVFIAVNSNENQKIIKRINGNEIEDTGLILKNVTDIAVDADNSLYVLQTGDKISRYDRVQALSYELGAEHVISDCGNLSTVTVSNIANAAVNYRDLIVTEKTGHRIRTVSCLDFGVEVGDVSTPPAADSAPTPVYLSKPIIRTVVNPAGAEVDAQSSEVTLLRTLPYGYKVIVPDYNEDGAFSLIFADNVILGSADYAKDPIITGYVHNEFLSDPLPYTDEHETECSAWISSVPVYKYPSRQAPKIDESADKGTAFKFLDFVYDETLGGVNYGYTDNFPDSDNLLNNHRWYRVSLEKNGGTYEGFVVASTVSVLAGNPDMSIRPQVNAEIIAKDKNVPTAGAIVYKKQDDGTYAADNRFEPLPVGTKVEVIGAFDSSEPYTQIAFFTPNGTVTAYVETANLKYHGVNVVKIVAIVLIVITAVLIIILCTRAYIIKRNKINKAVDKNNFDKDSEF